MPVKSKLSHLTFPKMPPRHPFHCDLCLNGRLVPRFQTHNYWSNFNCCHRVRTCCFESEYPQAKPNQTGSKFPCRNVWFDHRSLRFLALEHKCGSLAPHFNRSELCCRLISTNDPHPSQEQLRLHVEDSMVPEKILAVQG